MPRRSSLPDIGRLRRTHRRAPGLVGVLAVAVVVGCGATVSPACAMSVDDSGVRVDGVLLLPTSTQRPVAAGPVVAAVRVCGEPQVRAVRGPGPRVAVRAATDPRTLYLRPYAIASADTTLRRAIWGRGAGWPRRIPSWTHVELSGRVKDSGRNWLGVWTTRGTVLAQVDGRTRFAGRRADGLPAPTRGDAVRLSGLQAPSARSDGVIRVRARSIIYR